MKSAVSFLMMVLFCLCLISCGEVRQGKKPAFNDLYARLAFEPPSNVQADVETQKFSFSANKAPLETLLRQIADKCQISVIAHSSLLNAQVSVEIKNAPASEVLASIARSLDKRLSKIGATYFLGPAEPEDRGSLVRTVKRLNSDELKGICDLFKSEHGRASVTPDGLVVVADRVEVLERLNNTFDQIENASVGCWVVQLVVTSLGERTKTELGIQTDLTANFAANLAKPDISSWNATAAFSSFLKSVHDSSDSQIVAEPLVLVRDGSETVIRRGEDLRLPKKQTSPYGTVETVGYEIISTGLTIKTTVRDDTRGNAQMSLDVDLSAITGFVEDLPIITTQNLKSSTSLRSGGIYLLGSLESSANTRTLTGTPLPLLYGKEKSGNLLQIWGRVYKIAAPFSGAQPVAEGPAKPETATVAQPPVVPSVVTSGNAFDYRSGKTP